MKIGIAISTYNRPSVISHSIQQWKKYLPKGAVLVVVDDGSEEPCEHATYTMPSNAGIAAAKNKCIQLLMEAGCTDLFLADSDTYPKVKDWHKLYVNSGAKHLCFTFPNLSNGRPNGRQYLGDRNGLSEYGSPCGCLLYIHRDVIEGIGGFDVDYPQWGFEHVDFSNRAFNAGLTPARYLDVPNSIQFIHSMDYHSEVSGSVDSAVKSQTIPVNKERFSQRAASKEYMPYDHPTDGVILASYFNANPDPQRGTVWSADIAPLQPLVDSCQRVGVKLKIFHDCLNVPNDEIFIMVPKQHHYSPNAYRWMVYLGYLQDTRFDNVFMVDSTDVEVLRNPFLSLNPNRLYVGSEWNMKVENLRLQWLRKQFVADGKS